MTYDNRKYWPQLHEKLKGQLKAVGHPFLSEELNRLKYESEASEVEQALHKVMEVFPKNDHRDLSFLDLGAGTGFWTDLIFRMLLSNGYKPQVSALDVSRDALDVIKERLPYVQGIKADLATIPPDYCPKNYDLITSCYCFHHIVKTKDFIHALQFAGASVKAGGFLLIMDPILTKPYSKFDAFDSYSFRGNGIPRHLYFIDDILLDCGLRRLAVYPAVSFILNGCIEANTSLGYFLMSKLWKLLCMFYRSEGFVHNTAAIWTYADKALKNLHLAFSSSLCLYQKFDDRPSK